MRHKPICHLLAPMATIRRGNCWTPSVPTFSAPFSYKKALAGLPPRNMTAPALIAQPVEYYARPVETSSRVLTSPHLLMFETPQKSRRPSTVSFSMSPCSVGGQVGFDSPLDIAELDSGSSLCTRGWGCTYMHTTTNSTNPPNLVTKKKRKLCC